MVELVKLWESGKYFGVFFSLPVITLYLICLGLTLNGCGDNKTINDENSVGSVVKSTPTNYATTNSSSTPATNKMSISETTSNSVEVVSTPTVALPITTLPSTTSTSVATSANNWKTNWLSGIPCRLPCWQGITPGQTSLTQAINILKESPTIQASTVITKTSKVPNYPGEIYWKWKDGTSDARMNYEPKSVNQVITGIGLETHKSLTLGNIIQSYGEPSHVAAIRGDEGLTHPYYTLSFYWFPQGFSTAMYLGGKPIGNITADLVIDSESVAISIFGIPKPSDYAQEAGIIPSNLLTWQGYKDFLFYCRNYHDTHTCN